MIQKTRGIVFRYVKFRETSIIVTIFTESFGLQSYIVNGVRSARSSGHKIALYQPLTLLDLVVYHRETARINRIKELKCIHPYRSLVEDVRKSAIAMFITEVINKTVKEEAQAAEIFQFLFNTLLELDQQEIAFENFHLIFLVKLSRYLGFGAHTTSDIMRYKILPMEEEERLQQLIDADFSSSILLNSHQRRAMLDILIKFYAEHIESLGEIKSIHVLREVLS